MKKNRKHHRAGNKDAPKSRAGSGGPRVDNQPRSRRSVLRKIRNGTIVVALVSAGGWAVADQIRTQSELHDLTVLGNGIPTVVQIHDPQCPTCRRLQTEMLDAADHFADDVLQVRVANIRTAQGSAMARRYGVPHVTLLLFDGKGQMRQIFRGPNDSETLRVVFQAHVSRAAPSREGTARSG